MKLWVQMICLCMLVAPQAAALTPVEMLGAGTAYAERGSPRKAIPLLERALRTGKLTTADQARAHLALGMSFAQQDQSDKAAGHLEKAITLDVSQPKAYLLLGMTHDLAERPQQALEVYRRGIRALPGNAELLHELGLTELIAGEVESAVAHLRAARKRSPSSGALLGDLGYAELRAGHFDDAVTTLTEAMAYSDGNADLLTHLGDAHAGGGDIGKALDCYGRALDLEPGKIRPRYHQGLLRARQGDLVGAISAQREVLRREPRHRRAQMALAASLAQAGDGSAREAEKLLLQVVAAEPSFASAHAELGRLALLRHDLKGARKHLENAMARDSEHAQTRALLREVLEKQGDKAALKELDRNRHPRRQGGR